MKKTIKYHCLNCSLFCERENKGNFFGKYCCNSCQRDYEYKQRIEKWLAGELDGYVGKSIQLAGWVRRYIHENKGTACESCGWDEKHPIDNNVLTEIDHIDGNATNCKLSNLRVLCPNCHSKTSNFRARNKDSTRNRSKQQKLLLCKPL